MSIYTLKDRTIKMYKYKTIDEQASGVNSLVNAVANLTLSAATGFVNGFFPSALQSQISATSALISELTDVLTFSAVEKISIEYKAGIAVEQGLVVSFMQPWYIEPAVIKITGNSYLGCYPDISASDKDVENIYRFFNDRLREGKIGKSGDKKETVLEITNNPALTDKFVGFITAFEFSENIDKPYLLDYSIDFVGKPYSIRVTDEAKKKVNDDKAVVNPSVSSEDQASYEYVLNTNGKTYDKRIKQ